MLLLAMTPHDSAITADCVLFLTQEHSYANIGIIIFIGVCGVVCFIIYSLCVPYYYGKKLFILCVNEKEFETKDKTMSDKTKRKECEFYEPYAAFSRTMRAWLVAYGIGAPALLASQDAFKAILVVSNHAAFIIGSFLCGVSVQIIAAFIYKYSMGYLYFGELEKSFDKTKRYKVANWFSLAMWLEMLFDIISIGSFALATVMVLIWYIKRG